MRTDYLKWKKEFLEMLTTDFLKPRYEKNYKMIMDDSELLIYKWDIDLFNEISNSKYFNYNFLYVYTEYNNVDMKYFKVIEFINNDKRSILKLCKKSNEVIYTNLKEKEILILNNIIFKEKRTT